MIKLLIVDDQHVVRSGLRMLCDAVDDITVVGEAANGEQALQLLANHHADVVLMDLRMPRMDGITATERILARHRHTKILVLTTFDDDDHVYPALAAGAHGFLAKDADPQELLDAIRQVVRNAHAFSPDVLRRIVDNAVSARTHAPAAPELAELTERERQVLTLVGDGLSNAEISERLHVGVTTVKTHIANLMAKTQRPNRVLLAVLAAQTRLGPTS